MFNHLVELRMCSDSSYSSLYPFAKYPIGVITPVLKYLNTYVPKSIIRVVDPSKGPSPSLLFCLENYKCFIFESSIFCTFYSYMRICVIVKSYYFILLFVRMNIILVFVLWLNLYSYFHELFLLYTFFTHRVLSDMQ